MQLNLWRGGRVVEGARLESVYAGNCIENVKYIHKAQQQNGVCGLIHPTYLNFFK